MLFIIPDHQSWSRTVRRCVICKIDILFMISVVKNNKYIVRLIIYSAFWNRQIASKMHFHSHYELDKNPMIICEYQNISVLTGIVNNKIMLTCY